MLLSKPVIGAISGHAVAGGLELALWCDMRVAEEDAVLGVYCRRWGVPLVDGGTVRLPRLIGLGHAMDMILTGRPVTVEEALIMGLINRVAEKGKARAEAVKLAMELTKFPQICMNSDRLSAYEQFGMELDEAIGNECDRGMNALKYESQSGAARFASGKGRGGNFNDI
jgi:enoyl-CoA hydratase